MIITLAGHVDHGKTSLVEALTGFNTDTLDEEKRRGLTIDLGFCYADLDGQRVGFVDVPGHHRFIHNMVAGVASHQHALLVVAADDGPMPQTFEHLTILKLLGVTSGVAAVTKIDRVGADRVSATREAVAAMAHSAGLHLDGIVATSSIDRTGIDELRAHIAQAARAHRTIDPDRAFRLAIDRTFVVKGVGVVVTGTVHSGTLNTGDEVVVAPGGLAARARTLRVSDKPADHALPGDRCAVNLTGISSDQVSRGDWLVAPSTFAPTQNIVVDLKVLDDFPRPVKHWLPVHVYLAASHTEGHVALLDSARLGAGESALVELVVAAPLHPKHGDRLVLRDHARERTVGGGIVVDTAPPAKARRAPERLERLRAQRTEDPARALIELLRSGDVDLDAFRRLRNLTRTSAADASNAANPVEHVRRGRVFAVSRTRWLAVLDTLLAQIVAYHKAAPHSQGLKKDQISRMGVVPKPWLDEALATLVSAGRVAETGGHYHDPAHRSALAPDDASMLRRIEKLIDTTDQPPSIGDIAKSLGIALRTIDAFISKMTKIGILIRVGEHRVLLPRQIDTLSQTARRLAIAKPDGFSAREFRDAARIGRNLAIDVLEHFDRRGFTRRSGDLRRIIGDGSTLKHT
jgi:selenocysteine-specific elongation factor